MKGFTVQRKDPDGKPVGQRLTFTEEAFVIEPLADPLPPDGPTCVCGQTTARLVACPIHGAEEVL